MTDEATERLIRETFARCVPDEEARRTIAARVRAREMLEDPDVIAARQLLASASPEEIEAAFRVALERGSFAAASPATERATVWERLMVAARAMMAGMEATLDQLSGIFVAILQPASGLLGAEPDPPIGEASSFTFPLPGNLANLDGLPGYGDAEIDDGVLHIFINRTADGDGPQLVVLAVGDEQVTDPVALEPDTEYARLLTAAVDWPQSSTPIRLLIAIADGP